ncbi:MAG: deoxyribodipyrimidine photo-lyase [Bacillota bacterium]
MIISKAKIKKLNKVNSNNGKFVLYWMQASQRFKFNPAYQFAVEKANELDLPLLVIFIFDFNYPEAEYSHYKFMLEGLKELRSYANKERINFFIFKNKSKKLFEALSKKAAFFIVDGAYLNHLQKWRKDITPSIFSPFYEVESNVIFPVEEVSDKEEYAAYTIRKKIKKLYSKYLIEKEENLLKNRKNIVLEDDIKECLITDIDYYLDPENLNMNKNSLYISKFTGGYSEAQKLLNIFIKEKLADYSDKHSSPALEYQSNLSPYLHFGQISPLEIALKVKESKVEGEDFLEELIIRRELSFNFVHYNKNYDKSLKHILPDWAYYTLADHTDDSRNYIYQYKDFENFSTHDKYWNAAQKEMVCTGKMHGYMRMYWGKKILEWTEDPETAFKWALKLNNKYSLDGRDANSYAGVAWCFGKHDRAWKERKIYGKVRYMNKNGLERKFDMEKYLNKISSL